MKTPLVIYLIAIFPSWIYYFIQSVREARGLENQTNLVVIIIIIASLFAFVLNYSEFKNIETSVGWKIMSYAILFITLASMVGGVFILI